MIGLLSRIFRIAMWLIAMVVGLILIANGVVQFNVTRSIQNIKLAELSSMGAGVGLLAIFMIGCGAFICLSSLYKIYKGLSQPLESYDDMRADSFEMRIVYALGFIIAIGLSGYALGARAFPFYTMVDGCFRAEDASAKITAVEPLQTTLKPSKGGLEKMHSAQKRGPYRGSYIYYTRQYQPITISGPLPYRSSKYQPKPGDTFEIHYYPGHPRTHIFGARQDPLYLIPASIELIALIFMFAGAVSGLRQNLPLENRVNWANREESFSPPVSTTPQRPTKPKLF